MRTADKGRAPVRRAVARAEMAVDAVGVDLEQDGDAVPSAAGDLGCLQPGVLVRRRRAAGRRGGRRVVTGSGPG